MLPFERIRGFLCFSQKFYNAWNDLLVVKHCLNYMGDFPDNHENCQVASKPFTSPHNSHQQGSQPKQVIFVLAKLGQLKLYKSFQRMWSNTSCCWAVLEKRESEENNGWRKENFPVSLCYLYFHNYEKWSCT